MHHDMEHSFETEYSEITDLSFHHLSDCLEKRMHMSISTVYPFMMNQSGYNNLGLMMSDECPWHTVLMIHGRTTRVEGPLVAQFDRVMESVESLNHMIDSNGIPGTFRVFPTSALRETLINAYVHRDYEIPEPIGVRVDGMGITVESPGNVWRSLHLGSDGAEPSRNDRLYRVFSMMEGSNNKGRGFSTIKDAYKYTPVTPRALCRDGLFIVLLPPVPYVSKGYRCHRDKIHDLLAVKRGMTLREISSQMSMTNQYARKLLTRMENEGLIVGTGRGTGRNYFLCRPETAPTIPPIIAERTPRKMTIKNIEDEWTGRDSNSRPLPCQGNDLPTDLPAQQIR